MRRMTTIARPNWRSRVEELGLLWHTADGQTYWDETAYYQFTLSEIETIERATENVYQLFLQAGEHIVRNNLFHRFGIPAAAVPAIVATWEGEPPALNYGRFDFGFDGNGQPKLFEFNCDTPTSLLEASVIQWDWKEQAMPHLDQFNSLHERLVAKFRDLRAVLPQTMHFAHVADHAAEDTMTVSYLRDCAAEAGFNTVALTMDQIGYEHIGGRFVDRLARPIESLYKLYPWEWMVNEAFADEAIAASISGDTVFVEPIWKMIWSNKAILPILWELFPGHPNLLPAYFDNAHSFSGGFVKKPILAREGANITIFGPRGISAQSDGDYGEEGYVYQGLYELPGQGEQRPVIGSWVVDGEAAGMGIREDGPITGNLARFVPHVIKG